MLYATVSLNSCLIGVGGGPTAVGYEGEGLGDSVIELLPARSSTGNSRDVKGRVPGTVSLNSFPMERRRGRIK